MYIMIQNNSLELKRLVLISLQTVVKINGCGIQS